jgi:CBS domain containing-hemolysin-like protein
MNKDASSSASPGRSAVGLLRDWLRSLKSDWNRWGQGGAPAALNELIAKTGAAPAAEIGEAERRLLVNVLSMRQRNLADVMVPRAGIVAVEIGAKLSEVIESMTREGHSRLPVYRETLDDALGMVHIKDVLPWRGRDSEFALDKIMRRILFVAPSMRTLELLLEMRVKRAHMALVVDEFGGVDGLVTIEDLVEEIVGEIEDEHDRPEQPMLTRLADGAFEADGRVPLEDFERQSGVVFTPDERAEIDTLGGLVAAAAGQVPIRGQLVRHASGLEFEVLDADPRRIKRLRISRRPVPPAAKA